MIINPNTNTDQAAAAAMADGLRRLAAMVADHPHLATRLRYTLGEVSVPVNHTDDPRQQATAFAQAGLACGATVTDYDDDKWAGVNVTFGPVSLQIYARVEKIHPVTRSVEHTNQGTRRVVEYTPRSILESATVSLDQVGTLVGSLRETHAHDTGEATTGPVVA